jgi:spore coat polysaccharide biosynthesis protein SpsF (cytidylyltransferase family)
LVNGNPVIELLIARLCNSGIPIIVAVPIHETTKYLYLNAFPNVYVYGSHHGDDPLARTVEVANAYMFKNVVRVTHDKILVDPNEVKRAVKYFRRNDIDYLYGKNFIPGTGFEIFTTNVLQKASDKYKKIEFLGYAVRTVTSKIEERSQKQKSLDYRFLIDFPEDLQFFEVMFSQCGNMAPLNDYLHYLHYHPEIKSINKQPLVTIYTCAYNAEKWIDTCMDSVVKQIGFHEMEYIIIDDHSEDRTCEKIAKFALKNKNVKWLRNASNMGLASSSNVALKQARGKYIIRMDADDFFTDTKAVASMMKKMESDSIEAIYPHNLFGRSDKVQNGIENHHIGGAMFDKNAINHIKFTEGLRGYEGLDFFQRAKDVLKIGYYEKPIFFYRQHPKSLTKNNLAEREELRQRILDA